MKFKYKRSLRDVELNLEAHETEEEEEEEKTLHYVLNYDTSFEFISF